MSTTVEENKELVRRYTREVFDEGDVDAVDRFLAPDFYNQSPDVPAPTTSNSWQLSLVMLPARRT